MKQSGIYRIELGNGWFYIGSAQNLRKRESQHRSSLKQKDHCNQKMQNVWNKYGVFNLTILEHCPVNELINREQTYLDKHFDDLKNVNLTPTAGSPLGVIRSAETRAKMSAAAKNISAETRAKLSAARRLRAPASEETRKKLSAAGRKRIFSAETRAKLSDASKGKVLSAEHRAKISAANKGRVVSDETRKKRSEIKKAYWARKRAAKTSSI